MKTNITNGLKYAILSILVLNLFALNLFSEDINSQQLMKVTKNDGAYYIGYILDNNEREVTIETKDLGKMIIPKYEIKSIVAYNPNQAVSNELYGTRYFLTTNGLPINKDDDYLMLSLYGPEAHFAVSKNFSLGVMTSWFAVPIIGSAKYSINLAENLNLGLGTLVGTTSWAGFDGYGLLGYGALTLGNRASNLTVSGGYAVVGYDGDSGGAPLMSVAGMTPISKKVSFVFDSFIFLDDKYQFALLIPGLRFATTEKNSFQFGFCGVLADKELMPFPIPLLSWLRVID